jgi:hypothetical protein
MPNGLIMDVTQFHGNYQTPRIQQVTTDLRPRPIAKIDASPSEKKVIVTTSDDSDEETETIIEEYGCPDPFEPSGNTIVVATSAPSGSIQEAIDSAGDRDTIRLGGGNYFESVVIPEGKQLRFTGFMSSYDNPGTQWNPAKLDDGSNPGRNDGGVCVYVQATESDTLVPLTTNVVFENVHFRGQGRMIDYTFPGTQNTYQLTVGGSVYADIGDVYFRSCKFGNNAARLGGAVFGSERVNLCFEKCKFNGGGNVADYDVDAEAAYVGNDLSVNVNALNGGWRGGAILSFGPSLSVRDCNFSRLSITSCPFGGAICYRPDYKLSNGQWSTNHGLNTEAPRGRLEIVNTFISAARTTQGRGMLAAATHSDVYIANCTAAFNRCGNKKKFRGNGSVFYGDRGVELYLICNLFTDNDNVLENIGRGNPADQRDRIPSQPPYGSTPLLSDIDLEPERGKIKYLAGNVFGYYERKNIPACNPDNPDSVPCTPPSFALEPSSYGEVFTADPKKDTSSLVPNGSLFNNFTQVDYYENIIPYKFVNNERLLPDNDVDYEGTYQNPARSLVRYLDPRPEPSSGFPASLRAFDLNVKRLSDGFANPVPYIQDFTRKGFYDAIGLAFPTLDPNGIPRPEINFDPGAFQGFWYTDTHVPGTIGEGFGDNP